MMLFFNHDEQGHRSVTRFHFRWPLWTAILYVTGMAYAQAMYHPLPALLNARLSISKQEIINQMRWSAPVFSPNDRIDDFSIPNLVDRADAISPLNDDDYPLSFTKKVTH